MKRKIYLAGKISYLPINEVKSKFLTYKTSLESLGHEVISPFDNWESGKSWEEYMMIGLAKLFTCDSIFLIPGWESSKGARIELAVSRELKHEVYDSIEYMKQKDQL
jgi:Domain of unknown function (DUF4406)